MPKAYWIGHIDIRDPDKYEDYKRANGAAFAEFGARFVVRGGPQEVVEGDMRPRTVVLEFASLADAKACYESETYQAAKAIRDPISTGDMIIVEGYDA